MGSFLSSFLTPVGWVKSLMGIDKDVQQSNKVLGLGFFSVSFFKFQ